jgi:hypothetical protein
MTPIERNKFFAVATTCAGAIPGLNIVAGLVYLIYNTALYIINDSRQKSPEVTDPTSFSLAKKNATYGITIGAFIMIPVVGNVICIMKIISECCLK